MKNLKSKFAMAFFILITRPISNLKCRRRSTLILEINILKNSPLLVIPEDEAHERISEEINIKNADKFKIDQPYNYRQICELYTEMLQAEVSKYEREKQELKEKIEKLEKVLNEI